MLRLRIREKRNIIIGARTFGYNFEDEISFKGGKILAIWLYFVVVPNLANVKPLYSQRRLEIREQRSRLLAAVVS